MPARLPDTTHNPYLDYDQTLSCSKRKISSDTEAGAEITGQSGRAKTAKVIESLPFLRTSCLDEFSSESLLENPRHIFSFARWSDLSCSMDFVSVLWCARKILNARAELTVEIILNFGESLVLEACLNDLTHLSECKWTQGLFREYSMTSGLDDAATDAKMRTPFGWKEMIINISISTSLAWSFNFWSPW